MSEAQKKIALEIVEDLEREFSDLTWMCCSWDSEEAAKTIAMMIPQTAAEEEEEFRKLMSDLDEAETGPPRPSRFAALRDAVHATDGMSITCVIDAAVKRLAELQSIIDSKLHQRKCWDCGHVFYAADGVIPYCLCPECRSQDTRRVK